MQRKNKRQDIAIAAMRVFCYYGYDGATLERIAREAGISKALVIKYYNSVKELAIHCLQEFIQTLFEKIGRYSTRSHITFPEYIDYLFDLFKLSRQELRLLLTLFLTPAHQDITATLLPSILQFTQNQLLHFSEIVNHDNLNALNYVFFSMLSAYAIGGNEANFTEAKQAVLDWYFAYTKK